MDVQRSISWKTSDGGHKDACMYIKDVGSTFLKGKGRVIWLVEGGMHLAKNESSRSSVAGQGSRHRARLARDCFEGRHVLEMNGSSEEINVA